MPKVKILIKGYCSIDSNGHSCSTVTLVQDAKMKMIVDPGTLKSQKILINALKKEKLSVNDINVVYITHSHIDHYRNIGMFPKAKSLDFYGWYKGDYWQPCNRKITKNIKLIKTPGHNSNSTTLLVKTEKGVIAICGDVFWKKDYPKKDSYASDPKKLAASRKKLLKIADYIIPGHGDMFKV
jgi:glyoxylase-like metal-dependent hydrolase (beta-lactamase superfamily II)